MFSSSLFSFFGTFSTSSMFSAIFADELTTLFFKVEDFQGKPLTLAVGRSVGYRAIQIHIVCL